MTEQEAIALALAVARENGWPEKLRVSVTGGRKFILFGSYLWWVSLENRNANLWAQVTINDSTGSVIDVSSRPLNPRRKLPENNPPSEEAK
jgi:hypothetical protein